VIQSLRLLRTLHTKVTKNSARIQSIYQILFWGSRMWNSEMDVQRRWLCAVVTFAVPWSTKSTSGSRSDSCQLFFINNNNLHSSKFSWQQASKHINKSIISSPVNTCLSQYIAVSGVTGSGNNLWSFWFKACGMCHCSKWEKRHYAKEYCSHYQDRAVKE